MVNDKGETVDIPRPCLAVRVWNAETRCYDLVSSLLDCCGGRGREEW